ncbi:hypothetical protein C8Q74DRAFT_30757 [Fomes fomentarius]|nr:hypothetical protein C8Q74DRAFT_30757 [Fomes fomentarius]
MAEAAVDATSAVLLLDSPAISSHNSTFLALLRVRLSIRSFSLLSLVSRLLHPVDVPCLGPCLSITTNSNISPLPTVRPVAKQSSPTASNGPALSSTTNPPNTKLLPRTTYTMNRGLPVMDRIIVSYPTPPPLHILTLERIVMLISLLAADPQLMRHQNRSVPAINTQMHADNYGEEDTVPPLPSQSQYDPNGLADQFGNMHMGQRGPPIRGPHWENLFLAQVPPCPCDRCSPHSAWARLTAVVSPSPQTNTCDVTHLDAQTPQCVRIR